MIRNLVLATSVAALTAGAAVEAPPPTAAPPAQPPANHIDVLVLKQLDSLDITPSPRCTDDVFIRRITLDMCGTIPKPWDARTFLMNKKPAKRRHVVEQLFKSPHFAEYWAMKWCDTLRVKAEFPSKLWPNAVQAYHRWLRDAVRDNMPYDDFARALLTSSGSNFRVAPVNFYRAVKTRTPASISDAVALTFMGSRTDGWPETQRDGMAQFFSLVGYKGTAEWKEEIVFYDLPRAIATNSPVQARFPDGKEVTIDVGTDPRQVYADWLLGPDNPYFAKSIVNRLWFWLLGRGLVHEADDMRPDNPPSNPELLDWLAAELVTHDYDLRHIYRLILNSNTYQLSSVPNPGTSDDGSHFSYYPVRRLDAEVLIDAINQLAWSGESYSSEIPEPFTFIPSQHRAITLGDGSITSPFLDMFGRPPRDTGLLSERDLNPSDTQRLHLLNSSHIQRKLERSGALKRLIKKTKQPSGIVNQVYMTVLSRPPTDAEKDIALAYLGKGRGNRLPATLDLTWALINSKEFLYRH